MVGRIWFKINSKKTKFAQSNKWQEIEESHHCQCSERTQHNRRWYLLSLYQIKLIFIKFICASYSVLILQINSTQWHISWGWRWSQYFFRFIMHGLPWIFRKDIGVSSNCLPQFWVQGSPGPSLLPCSRVQSVSYLGEWENRCIPIFLKCISLKWMQQRSLEFEPDSTSSLFTLVTINTTCTLEADTQ